MAQNKSTLDKILILGAQGQIGRALGELIPAPNRTLATRTEADLSEPDQCLSYLRSVQPSAIVNAAAFTQVDLAEKEQDLVRKVNTETPGILASWCAEREIPFIHFSSDYVFSGEGTQPWNETDPVAPLNTYGFTKAEGEHRIEEQGGRYLIFRTSWVYDSIGKNFFTTLVRLGQERESLKIVNDQTGAPTYAPDLAFRVLMALEKCQNLDSFPSGIYHLCNAGETTWYNFAQTIFNLLRKNHIPLKLTQVEPIETKEYLTPARRPLNSRLNTQKTYQTFGISLPHWTLGLETCIKKFITTKQKRNPFENTSCRN